MPTGDDMHTARGGLSLAASRVTREAGPRVRVPSAPPVSALGTFFFLLSPPSGTAQNAGLSGLLSEPQAPPERPFSGRFPSLCAPFL